MSDDEMKMSAAPAKKTAAQISQSEMSLRPMIEPASRSKTRGMSVMSVGQRSSTSDMTHSAPRTFSVDFD